MVIAMNNVLKDNSGNILNPIIPGYEKLKATILFENAAGTFNTINLLQDPNKFNYLEIYGITNDSILTYTKIDKSHYNKTLCLFGFNADGNLYLKLALVRIVNQTIEFQKNIEWYKNAGSSSGGFNSGKYVAITKVVAYK